MRLLICDDHAIFREGLKSLLSDVADEVLEAADAESALARLARDSGIDIVLLDLTMPGTDGWTALRKIRGEHPSVPVVIVSATDGDVG